MRILHTADWHLGRTLHGESLEEATACFLDWLVLTVQRESVDVVLIAGDIYDRGVPPPWAVRALDRILLRLSSITRVVLIPGNHDSATRLGFGADLLQAAVAIRTAPEAVDIPTEVDIAGDRVLIYSIPYLDPDLSRYQLADGDRVPPRSHEGVVGAALDRIADDLHRRDSDRDAAVIVMAHAFLTGGLPSDSERNIEVGGAAVVPAGLFDRLPKLDYVALGHLHRPQSVRGARAEIRYSGSPIPLSFSEADVAKSVTLLDVEDGLLGQVRTLETPVFRPLGVLRASMESLENGDYEQMAGHWLSITVTDDSRPDRLVPRLRRLFPHALSIAHQPTRVSEFMGVGRVTREVDPREVIDQFFVEVGGRPLVEAERTVLDDMLMDMRRREAS